LIWIKGDAAATTVLHSNMAMLNRQTRAGHECDPAGAQQCVIDSHPTTVDRRGVHTIG
jgi:hypothetical protein